jgi:hypothetical protein
MKTLMRYLAFALMVGSAYAQSNLSACQGSYTTKWSNCNGTFTFANGNKYVGVFKDGKFHGLGTLYTLNGSIINQGIWADNTFIRWYEVQQATVPSIQQSNAPNPEIEKQSNLPDCQGNYSIKWTICFGSSTFFSGDRYIGEFKVGLYNGQGILTFADGSKYVGEFKDDKRNGEGTLYASNGSIINQGIWANNIFVRSALVQQAVTPNVQQSNAPNTEIEKLRAEAELERKRRQELEEQLRLSQQQQQPQTTTQTVSVPSIGRRVALVVGNANYKVRPLKNPRNDADDISRSLRSSGFEVIDLRDASLQQMRNGVRQFGDRLINNDVGLVYFSGHGVEVKGRNYFIPVNADIMREDEIADQGLDVSLILEKMNTAGKGVNILIVDACRDDPFGRSFRSSSRGLAQMDAPRGTIIAYATSPGKVASDGDPRERNSPYTKNLVKAMQQPNKPIEQVFKEVRRAVQEETKNQQTPWENTSLSGDFYFKVQR